MGLFLKKDDSIFNKQKFNQGTFFDRPNQGFSNQPYIESQPDNELNNNSNDKDFLVRGGSKLAGRIIDDEQRLIKLFTDTRSISGFLFTTKQNLLSRLNVNTDYNSNNLINQGIYTPDSTILNAALSPVGIHTSLFSNQFKYDDYFNDLNNLSKSQLIQLNKKREDGEFGKGEGILKQYSGGPGSDLGVGKTLIPFSDKKTQSTLQPKNWKLENTETGESILLKDNNFISAAKSNQSSSLEEKYNQFNNILEEYYINKNYSTDIINSTPTFNDITEQNNKKIINTVTENIITPSSNYYKVEKRPVIKNQTLNQTKFVSLIENSLNETVNQTVTFNNNYLSDSDKI